MPRAFTEGAPGGGSGTSLSVERSVHLAGSRASAPCRPMPQGLQQIKPDGLTAGATLAARATAARSASACTCARTASELQARTAGAGPGHLPIPRVRTPGHGLPAVRRVAWTNRGKARTVPGLCPNAAELKTIPSMMAAYACTIAAFSPPIIHSGLAQRDPRLHAGADPGPGQDHHGGATAQEADRPRPPGAVADPAAPAASPNSGRTSCTVGLSFPSTWRRPSREGAGVAGDAAGRARVRASVRSEMCRKSGS